MGWDRNGDGLGDVPYGANDMVDRLSWRHPMVKLLIASPAIQTLRLIAQQFPAAARADIVDKEPTHAPRPFRLEKLAWQTLSLKPAG